MVARSCNASPRAPTRTKSPRCDRAPAVTPALPAIRVVLLDLRQHPVELAGGDVGSTMLARARHRDVQRRAAVATGRVGPCGTLASGAADERPVLAVRPVGALGAADDAAGVGAHDVVLAGAPDPDRHRVVPAIAHDLREVGAGELH